MSGGETRAIVLEFNVPMLIDVLVDLKQNHAWNPVYIVSNNTREQVTQHFPSAIYQDTADARYGRAAPELADISASCVMDQPTAEALGYAETIALRQMDRMELLGGFSLRERLFHFHRLVAYWTAVFDRLRPDVLLFNTAPHVVYDYMAYVLARRRGIRTVLFEYVGTDIGMVMAIDRFEDGLPPLMEEYRRLRANPPSPPVKLSDRMEAYWQQQKRSYDEAVPFGARRFLANAEKNRLSQFKDDQKPKGRTLKGALSHLRSTLAPGRAIPPPVGGHYKGHFHVLAPDDIASEAAKHRREHAEAMKRRYEELALEPDLSEPFIYVPLAMQPERTTNPNGGVFDDQDLVVGVIAAALPRGWRIYVKDHPSQFAYGTWVERGRWPRFYDAVLSYPNASLVPLNTPQFDLIDRAQAVATTAGTSSWQALARGVPTLVFGEAWYKGCDGAYTAQSIETCRQALERIKSGERPDPEAVRLFLYAADRTAFVGYLGDGDETLAGIDETENVKRLTRAIVDCYEKSVADIGPRVSAQA